MYQHIRFLFVSLSLASLLVIGPGLTSASTAAGYQSNIVTYKNINPEEVKDIPTPLSRGEQLVSGEYGPRGGGVTNLAPPSPGTQYPIHATLPGSFNVDAQGSGSYQIPLSAPGGINGMVPTLGLAFSTGAGNGIAGYGWSISGLSSIMRCGSNILLNGERRPVRFDADDNWCLDGKMLVDTGQGYYRTKIESDTVVHDQGNRIRVEEKSGIVKWYEANDQIQSYAPNGGILVHGWLLSKVEDRYNNAVEYEYEKENTFSSGMGTYGYRLKAVKYTSNATMGVQAERALVFEYESRPTPIVRYSFGAKYEEQNRLKKIWLAQRGAGYVPHAEYGVPLKAYELSYIDPQYDPRTYLQSVQLCESPATWGQQGTDCYPPTVFSWTGIATNDRVYPNLKQTWYESNPSSNGLVEFSNLVGPIAGSYSNPKYQAASANSRRGFTRAIDHNNRVRSMKRKPYYSQTAVAIPYGSPNTGLGVQTTIDGAISFNDALWMPLATMMGNICALYCGSGASQEVTMMGEPTNPDHPDYASFEFNVVRMVKDRYYFDTVVDGSIEARDQFFSDLQKYYAVKFDDLAQSALVEGDFDGDGKQDLWTFKGVRYGGDLNTLTNGPGLTRTYPLNDSWDLDAGTGLGNERKRFFKYMNEYLKTHTDFLNSVLVGDFNADGKDDIYLIKGNGSSNDEIHLSNGDRSTWTQIGGPKTSKQNASSNRIKKLQIRNSDKGRIRFGDFNCDGYVDVYYIEGNDGANNIQNATPTQDKIYLNKGDGSGDWSQIVNGPYTTVRAKNISYNKSPYFPALTNLDISRIKFGDFNGDGCTDVLEQISGSTPGSESYTQFGETGTEFGGVQQGLYHRIHFSRGDGSSFKIVTTDVLDYLNPQQVRDDISASSWQWPDSNGEHEDQKVQFQWVESQSQVSAVRIVDINSDGLSDLYVFRGWGTYAEDDVYLSKGDGTFIPMKGANTLIGNPKVELNGSQAQIDIGRHIIVGYVSDQTPGMWVGGAYDVISGAPALYQDRYIQNNLSIPQLNIITNGLGQQTNIDYTIERGGNTDVRVSRRVVSAVKTDTTYSTAPGILTQGDAIKSYRYHDPAYDFDYGFLGYGKVDSEQVILDENEQILAGSHQLSEGYYRNDPQAPRLAGTAVRAISYIDKANSQNSPQWQRVSENENGLSWVNSSGCNTYCYRLLANDANSSDPDAQLSIGRTWDINDTQLTESTITATYDVNGNVNSLVTQKLLEGSRSTTDTSYTTADAARFGLPTSMITETTTWDGQTGKNIVWRNYNNALNVSVETIPFIDANNNVVSGKNRATHYQYDGFGHLIKQSDMATGETTRITESQYSTNGRYLLWIKNPLGHQIDSLTYDNEFDVPLRVSDANGLETTTEIDQYGRVIRNTGPDGVTSEMLYDAPISGGEMRYGGVVRQWTMTSLGGINFITQDLYGRNIRSGSRHSTGQYLVSETLYDGLGRSWKQSQPYLTNDGDPSPVRWSETSIYDAQGRVIETTAMNGAQTTYRYDLTSSINSPYYTGYSGLRAQEVENDQGQVTTSHFDAIGRLVGVENALGEFTYYQYDTFGEVSRTMDDAGNEIVLHKDGWGRKWAMVDPDMGSWVYEYNLFGELIKQTDEKGNEIHNTYDDLGRLILREDYVLEGTDVITLKKQDTTEWEYDTAANGIGLLASSMNRHEENAYYYDTLSRSSHVETKINTDYSSQTRTIETQYDGLGRAHRQLYRTGGLTSNTLLTLETLFDSTTGSIDSIQEVDNSGAPVQTFWQPLSYDNQGRLTTYELGNGVETTLSFDDDLGLLTDVESEHDGTVIQDLRYAYDSIGNMNTRWDQAIGVYEQFNRDDLNRLTGSLVAGLHSPQVTTYSYDNLGNIEYKSDVSNSNYVYGSGVPGSGQGPHAVQQVGEWHYQYDGNGNMASEHRQIGTNQILSREYGYTAFNKVNYMRNHGNIVGDDYRARINHGVNRQKVLQREYENGSASSTKLTYYFGGLDFINKGWFGSSHEISIPSPSGMIGRYIIKGADRTMHYMHMDHLGSPDKVTDESGIVIEAQSFDAFGAPRNPQDWSRYSGFDNPQTPLHEEGYTGHDRLDGMRLTNMIARMYDYKLGRFIQADTIIPSATNSQAYNRYSYVNNQPLTHIDPDGHSPWSFLANTLITAAINSTTTIVTSVTGVPLPSTNGNINSNQSTNGVLSTPVLGAAMAKDTGFYRDSSEIDWGSVISTISVAFSNDVKQRVAKSINISDGEISIGQASKLKELPKDAKGVTIDGPGMTVDHLGNMKLSYEVVPLVSGEYILNFEVLEKLTLTFGPRHLGYGAMGYLIASVDAKGSGCVRICVSDAGTAKAAINSLSFEKGEISFTGSTAVKAEYGVPEKYIKKFKYARSMDVSLTGTLSLDRTYNFETKGWRGKKIVPTITGAYKLDLGIEDSSFSIKSSKSTDFESDHDVNPTKERWGVGMSPN